MKSKVLITGSAGFIGYHLAKKLCSFSDFEVFGVDNFSRHRPDDSYQTDIVFHLAALNGTANFYEKPLEVIRSGIIPTLNLLEVFGSKPPKKLIYAGTSESYAGAVTEFNYRVPTPEQVPLVIPDVQNPRWSYAASKSLSEVAIATSAAKIGFEYNIIRFHNVYGPRMGFSHVIPELTIKASKGDYRIFGAHNSRSFIFIEDALDAIVLLLNDTKLVNHIVNIGTEELIEIRELARHIYNIMGIKASIEEFTAPEGSVLTRCPDITKLKSIGFNSKFKLLDGLNSTVPYYLDF